MVIEGGVIDSHTFLRLELRFAFRLCASSSLAAAANLARRHTHRVHRHRQHASATPNTTAHSSSVKKLPISLSTSDSSLGASPAVELISVAAKRTNVVSEIPGTFPEHASRADLGLHGRVARRRRDGGSIVVGASVMAPHVMGTVSCNASSPSQTPDAARTLIIFARRTAEDLLES